MAEARSFQFTASCRAPKGISSTRPRELDRMLRSLSAMWGDVFDPALCSFTERSIRIGGTLRYDAPQHSYEHSAIATDAARFARQAMEFAAHRLWDSPWLSDRTYKDALIDAERISVKQLRQSRETE